MRILIVCVLVLGLAACAGGEAFDYTPGDETPAGPGLFSGEDGEFSLNL